MQVFVYGTLTEPQRVESVLGPDGWSFAGERILEGLERVDGAYPTLVPGRRVRGRLLETDEAGLARLDAYEGVDRGLYVRVSVPLADADRTAWVYVGDPAKLDVDGASWPGEGGFASRVRTHCDRSEIVVRTHE
ncbi:gamma-glutamylcyclotransferase family protein [Natrononativus amylolyticus]|uniref:gamma-glutamylcyclotransferase family protein n=1 Tax=Natrononativus amylolyticus TaxID=2963434 RepID=UPI0020CFC149|nr:gamma-glutamylcyclotransferase family protein [Natrononativus amylolyticus]